ncbi:MAG: SH3 domain-containing protein [Anaerolineales bacterium]|nr:SH3 domain-containing protein [Anaerolineales bacterium]
MRHITFLLCSLLAITLPACQRAIATPTPADSAPVLTAPTLTVQEATNCRAGPGTDYDIIVTYPAGTKLEIAGRYDPGNFWLVKSAESPTGTCWMWGEYVEVTGSYSGLPSVTPPPTSTTGPSSSGTLFVEKWEFSCSGGTLTFTMNWNDQASDETGYRIFRNGEQLIELPANSTTYTDSLNVSAGEITEYYLQIFGPSGTIDSSVMRAQC